MEAWCFDKKQERDIINKAPLGFRKTPRGMYAQGVTTTEDDVECSTVARSGQMYARAGIYF